MRAPPIAAVLFAGSVLAGCGTAEKIAPDRKTVVARVEAVAPPPPVTMAPIPNPVPLPPERATKPFVKRAPEPRDPAERVASANASARVQPSRADYENAVQVYAYEEGALFQVYTAPGHVTDLALEAGEKLTGSGPVAAGDTARWIIGDTESGSGPTRRVHILIKPTQPRLTTNLVVNTDRRTYHVELRSTPATYMASVSWRYPRDVAALHAAETPPPTIPIVPEPSRNSRRYRIEGAKPAWRPLRAWDDGQRTVIEFPESVAQDELPPLFVVGRFGRSDLVNYRVHGRRMIVDRLFQTAELRLGEGRAQQRVRIVRR